MAEAEARRQAEECFNCTFMELKSDPEAVARLREWVLIVPLWN